MKKISSLIFLAFVIPAFLYSQKVTMNFDSLPDFSLSFGAWKAVDVDSSDTYGFQGFGFPHNTYPMAFIAFNPALTTPPMDTIARIQPHSGPLFGACFSATSPPNNDWFISPKVKLKYDGKFSLWLKSYTAEFGLEKYRIAVSVTDSNPSSFAFISGTVPLEAPLTWTKMTFSLSAYNNQDVYVAVQCVSNDAFIFMIDDLEVDPGTDNPGLPSSISEDFENMPDFSKDLNPWTVVDVNGGITYGIEGFTFPHSGEPMAYIVFNPSQVTPPMLSPGIQAHSGNKFAGSFASMPNNNPNNKWLISPRLRLGPTPKIGLWTETFNPTYGMEKYRICVSTKTNAPDDFVPVSGIVPLEAPMNWGYHVADLSAYEDSTVYVAIQCVSDNTFLFMVDDIEIGSAVGTGKDTFSQSFIISPVPAKDHFVIASKSSVTIEDPKLLDESGRKVCDLEGIMMSGNQQRFLLPRLASGMYFVSWKGENGTVVRKILVNRD